MPQANDTKMNGNSSNKVAMGKSIKMYLTIFIATTCVYMVLYQYHMSRQPLATNEVIKVSGDSLPYPLSLSTLVLTNINALTRH